MRGAGGGRGGWWRLGEPHLEVEFQHKIGALQMAVSFRTTAPWTVLFGASGSGKSTILRAIAGVLRPDRGRIVIGGEVVFDSAAGVWVPSHQRRMRWAPQRALLFPRKKVRSNLPMGIEDGRRCTEELDRLIDHFGLQSLADQYPSGLSGGEQQRLGVIRAAAGVNGRVLLLDEPFVGQDEVIRDALIENLRIWIGAAPVVSVTHDVGEAFLLGAEVVRIVDGRVVAQGPVETVLTEERQRLLRVLG